MTKHLLTKHLLIIAFCAAVLIGTMTACHTVQGAGQDIQSVGEAMQGS